MPARSTRQGPRTRTAKRPAPARLLQRRAVVGAAIALAVVAAVAVTVIIVQGGAGEPRRSAGLDPFPGADPGVAHVHGLGVDPADGTLYAATHYGLFQIPEKGKATRVANRYQDTMGFTVVGPGDFLGSGHPDPRENDLPSRLGLIHSTDGGQTWTALSLAGQADFHALEARHGTVYGYDSGSGRFMVSTDRRSWERGATLPMADFAVSPANPGIVLATTQRGLARSTDTGRTFTPSSDAPGLVVLAWPTEQTLYGVGSDGVVRVSADGGSSWTARGRLDGEPEAIAAPDDTRLYVATSSGIHASTDGGRTFTLRYRDGANQ